MISFVYDKSMCIGNSLKGEKNDSWKNDNSFFKYDLFILHLVPKEI